MSEAEIERCFQKIEVAAAKGERCPQNDSGDVTSIYVTALARAGRIRVHLHGRNWRVVVILEGPHLGKWTASDPKGGRLYRVIDQQGDRFITKRLGRPGARPQPSPPRLLTNSGETRAGRRDTAGPG